MYMAGMDDEEKFDEIARKMTVKGYMDKVRCPTLLATGEFDPLCPLEDAVEVFEDLTCPKEMWVIENQFHPLVSLKNLGGTDHHQPILDWLQRVLAQGKVNQRRIAYVKESCLRRGEARLAPADRCSRAGGRHRGARGNALNPLVAVALSLTSAVLFATFSVMVRKALSAGTAYAGVVISLAVGLPMLGGLSLAVSSWGDLTLVAAGWFLLGGILAPGIGRLLLFQGIRHIGVGRTMPLVMLTPFFSTTLAVAWLGERPGPAVWAATASVVAGCVLLSVTPAGDADWRRIHLLLPLGHASCSSRAGCCRPGSAST
ncbi:MAG: EamA family transporter [Candidatus Tectomicrobia bacterium]|nr:EamA family transporter [Candidatus Tectomicrobia bacterium]